MHQHDEDKYDLSVLEEMGYERRDVQVERSPSFVLWFFGSVLVTFLITAGFMWWLQPSMVGTQEPAQFRRMPASPNPILQSNRTAHRDMVDLKQKEKAALNSYGYVDKEKGIVSVPIDVAKDMLLASPPATRPNAKEPQQGG